MKVEKGQNFTQSQNTISAQPESELNLQTGKISHFWRRNKYYIASVLGLLIIIFIFLGVYSFRGSISPKISIIPRTKQELPTKPAEKEKGESLLVELGVGFKVGINKNWDVEVVESGEKHNFLKARDSSGLKVEIEAFSHSLSNWQSYLKNPLFQIEQTEIKEIAGNRVKIEKGKELFAQSTLRLITGIWETQNKTLVIRCNSTNQSVAESAFEQLAKTVSFEKTKSILQFNIVKNIFAYENTFPTNLPSIEYRIIKIMEQPIEDSITKADSPYKDGFAKGYKFTAFKSQRLTTVVFEDRESNPNSFVHSQLFDFNGNKLSEEMDTRIVFKAPYTGEYFLIVWSFNKQEGEMRVGIDDRDQTDVKTYIKYPDGAELLKDPEESDSILVGEFDVGLIIQIPKPIVVIDENTIEYEHTQIEFGQSLGLIRSKIHASMAPDFYKRKGLQPIFKNIDDDEQYRIKIKILQIGANRLLVTPTDGLFPKNHQVFITEKSEGGIRFFTQNKTMLNLPIMQQILNDYPDDFVPLTEGYFDWILPSGESTEMVGGWLQYKRQGNKNQVDQFKQYFLGKGYVIDEKNVYRTTIGLVKGNTVCKVEYSEGWMVFSIYCGNLR